MSATRTEVESPSGGSSSSTRDSNIFFTILKFLGLMLLDAFGLIIIYSFLYDGNAPLALIFAVITIFANVIIFTPRLYPLRWMTPGFMLITLLVIYPLILTVVTAFTNLGDGHLFTKEQSVELITARGYVPENATTYEWVPFRRGEEEFALWLTDADGQILFALPGVELQEVSLDEFGVAFSPDEPPIIEGYTIVDDPTVLAETGELTYGDPVDTVRIASLNLDVRYIYDIEQQLILDQERGDIYSVTAYSDGNGGYALWLINAEVQEPDEALVFVPGNDFEEVDLTDNDSLAEFNVSLSSGVYIPEAIGEYSRVDDVLAEAEALSTFSFEDIGDGMSLTTLDLSSQFVFDPEQGVTLDIVNGDDYETTVYVNEAGDYALWLDAGRSGSYLLRNDGVMFYNGIPIEYQGYSLIIENRERTDALRFLQNLDFEYFGVEGDTLGVINTRAAGRPYLRRYIYDAEQDTIRDVSTGTIYIADEELGAYIPEGGAAADALQPGYRVSVGFFNFTRLVGDSQLLGPLINVFVWTVVFALFSVISTFVVGLFMAIILDDPLIPGKKIIRSLLIIPYAIPGVIAILVWQGMLNQNLGIITRTIADATGYTIPWFSDATWAKIAILLVNLWLGYPYMMLICSGALQAIPSDIYEAAAVDGAKAWQRFRRITLPLLLITVGPLLIASFVFNFNNYLIVEALTQGDPPIPGAATPAGYTDILISYTYELAFGGSRGADYGYASAITIIIFLLVATVTLFQYRFTRTWEEVGENV